MLPCVQIPPLDLGGVYVYPFAVLVATGVVTGHWWAVRESARQGLRAGSMAWMGLSMVAMAFVCSWLFRMAYQPGWPRGITAFGGIFGGLLGAWLYQRRYCAGEQLLRYLDVFTCAFAIGWIFGRTGCSIAHDHLGRRATVWFAVDCPGGPRFDLGLIELVWTILIAALLVRFNRAPHVPGVTLGLFLTLYGPFRILLDRLHENPPRWFFWTVDRWSGCAVALCGISLLIYCFERARKGALAGTEGIPRPV
jgi:phosphatidylglycerol---prolipoprotein diacylglyceryl transferase